jgi:Terminase large subunit, T4likevirus-type, N-terminal
MKVTLKRRQWAVFNSQRRFRVLAAGRRFGKTYLALTELCRAAWGSGRLAWYVAPTYRQAKRIAWKPLKQMTKEYWAGKPNETDLSIELICGGTIALRGADHYDNLRGDGLDFVVLDEYASMAPAAWTEVLRPALSDKLGRALFIGTPKGFNHFYDLFQNAEQQEQWEAFRYTTEDGGNVPAEELRSASSELDERTYRQEFQASFENLSHGLVYYAFSRAENVRTVRPRIDEPLYWSLDFNVDPMTSVICQVRDESTREDITCGRRVRTVHVLDEIVLPNSNTAQMCAAFVERVRSWGAAANYRVQVYGDAAGDARSTAGRSDYQIIKGFFRTEGQFQVSYYNSSANPAVRDRVNAVNSLLCNHNQQRRLIIDPRCKHLIKDLERVSWKADGHDNLLGQVDKSNPQLTHVSDALGYMIEREFGFREVGGPRSTCLF